VRLGLPRRDFVASLRLYRSDRSGAPWSHARVYRGTHLRIRAGTDVRLEGPLDLGLPWRGSPRIPSSFHLGAAAGLRVHGPFKIYAGTSIMVGRSAVLELGSGYINNFSRIFCFDRITIGERVAIAEDVIIRDSDNHTIERPGYTSAAPIVIGDHVWIGMRAMILKGVTIGDDAVVAAGAIVTRDVPSGSLVAGVPARVIREEVRWSNSPTRRPSA
jgi:acetyltransferase-like isoleucine patch superfamily enzyme